MNDNIFHFEFKCYTTSYYIQDKTKEFEEDVIITLTAKNPQALKDVIRFNGITKKFVTIKLVESMIDHLNIESTILHRNSEEAKKQLELEAGSNIFLLLENNLPTLYACYIN